MNPLPVIIIHESSMLDKPLLLYSQFWLITLCVWVKLNGFYKFWLKLFHLISVLSAKDLGV